MSLFVGPDDDDAEVCDDDAKVMRLKKKKYGKTENSLNDVHKCLVYIKIK